ncbi:hypothetical protein ACROYT_G029984 [Oculina patagonica]
MEEVSDVTASHKPGSIKHGTPTDEQLEELGEEIAANWKKLGRRLGIGDPKLQEIHEAHDQLSERGYDMLKHWKQDKGSAATYQALCDALTHKLVQRQDLAEQFCYINYGTSAIQLPVGPLPEEEETGKIPVATTGTWDNGVSSTNQDNSSSIRSSLKRKNSEPANPKVKRGELSFKIGCAFATSRNSGKQDLQEEREKVHRYMAEKVDEWKERVVLSSYKGLRDLYAHLVGELHLIDVTFDKSSIQITVTCCTLEILRRLWEDYCSGRLNAVVQKCLVTEKVKDELDMETIMLTTTILEEDYFACQLSLVEISGGNTVSSTSKTVREANQNEERDPPTDPGGNPDSSTPSTDRGAKQNQERDSITAQDGGDPPSLTDTEVKRKKEQESPTEYSLTF